jgi:hypothetical protein
MLATGAGANQFSQKLLLERPGGGFHGPFPRFCFDWDPLTKLVSWDRVNSIKIKSQPDEGFSASFEVTECRSHFGVVACQRTLTFR